MRSREVIRLAMLGMIPGNGHPYSWSAIINGYNPLEMAKCPYPTIPKYLGAQPLKEVRIPNARVTHLWTDDPAEAPLVAAASCIPHIVSRPEEIIGEVDAVIISTDDGTDHVRRVRPFVEAGLPVFVDKPLATTRGELAQFIHWRRGGARILSSSGRRYMAELSELRGRSWRWLTSLTCKTWERYGIHALEPLYTVTGPGLTHVRSDSQDGSDIVYCRHRNGTQATVAAIHDATGSFGVIHAYGTEGEIVLRGSDTYQTFRAQLLAIIEWLRSGIDPYPFDETIELMAILIAAQDSRARGGELISVESVLREVQS